MIRCFSTGLLAALLGLAGCAVGPDFAAPQTALPSQDFTPRDGRDLAASLSPEPPPAAWWDLLGDPLLTALQQEAVGGNLDLRVAASRLAQSRAQLRIAGAAQWPALSASAGYAREGESANGKMAALGAPSHSQNYWQAGVDARWEIDLWGHAARLREQAGAEFQASVAEARGLQVMVAAEIARQYVLLRGMQRQIDIAVRNEAIASQVLRLAHSRERFGTGTRYDTAAASAQWASVKALRPDLERRRDLHLNALARLLGLAPRALDARLGPPRALPRPLQQVPVGVPSELARRRPDIQQAQARLHAATAAVGVAQADFYPRLTLGGSLGSAAFQSGDIAHWASRQFSFGPALYLPIFEGGRLRGTLALTQAREQEAAIVFQQTVLQAWHEVDDALNAWAAQQRGEQALTQAEADSRRALHAARRAYEQGQADYLRVLMAQRQQLDSELALARSAVAGSLSVVTLYKALGGGWQESAPLAEAGA